MLKQRIQSDATEALKSGDQLSSVVLRMLLSSLTSKEKEKRYKASKEELNLKEEDLTKKSELTDDEIVNVISSEVKKRKDAIALYLQGNRQELADKEKIEIDILQKYLPEQLSVEELKKLVAQSISNVGAKEVKDMGKIIQDLAPKVKGKADNSEISKIVKEFLLK